MDPSFPTLILDHVSKSFGDFKAVSDLSVQVRPGRVFGLIGPNGAGKTTTIRMIVNITAPDTGTIKLFGKSMTTALQDRIGYLPEERGLYRKMNKSQKVLDGQLREVRRSFAQNVVALRVEGADGLLNDPELITNVRQNGDDTEVLLTADASPQVLLKRLVDANVKITKFELVEPTLHDIFIAKVKESA